MKRSVFLLLLFRGIAAAARALRPGFEQPTIGPAVKLPLKTGSVRFAIIGDSGTGERPQIEVGRQMETYRKDFPFDFVLMMGDNIYGSKTDEDFRNKFERPYAPLLSAGVKFYASLGNHDHTSERLYKPFNMDGQRYYTFKNANVQFFALDSNYMDPAQLEWLDRQLSSSGSTWKICYFHHPLYSHGKFHGSDVDLRAQLEPMLVKYKVNVVLNGHEHVYERVKPQQGIYYFVLGNSGELRPHNLNPSPDTEKGFDTDRTFGLFEIAGDQFTFQIVSRMGATVDSGVFQKFGN
jgi:3',5'-cyclic AMP phosphodiesterase CpdA